MVRCVWCSSPSLLLRFWLPRNAWTIANAALSDSEADGPGSSSFTPLEVMTSRHHIIIQRMSEADDPGSPKFTPWNDHAMNVNRQINKLSKGTHCPQPLTRARTHSFSRAGSAYDQMSVRGLCKTAIASTSSLTLPLSAPLCPLLYLARARARRLLPRPTYQAFGPYSLLRTLTCLFPVRCFVVAEVQKRH